MPALRSGYSSLVSRVRRETVEWGIRHCYPVASRCLSRLNPIFQILPFLLPAGAKGGNWAKHAYPRHGWYGAAPLPRFDLTLIWGELDEEKKSAA